MPEDVKNKKFDKQEIHELDDNLLEFVGGGQRKGPDENGWEASNNYIEYAKKASEESSSPAKDFFVDKWI